jgi:hypothetical protein
MAGELYATYQGAGATLYALIRKKSDGTVWNGSAFVSFSAGDIATYDVPLTDQGGDYYSADFPSGIAQGVVCGVVIYEQAGGTPATTDEPLHSYTHTSGNASAAGAPTGDDLTTTARYKTFAGISSSSYDTKIGYLITAASKAIHQYCDVATFHDATYTDEVYNGRGHRFFVLRNRPVISLTNIKLHTNSTSDTTTYLGSQFNVESTTGEVRFDPDATTTEAFRGGFQNITATYEAGYTTIPADLELICWQVLDYYYNRAGTATSSSGLKGETIGDYKYENFPTTTSTTVANDLRGNPAFEDVRTSLAAGGYYKVHFT